MAESEQWGEQVVVNGGAVPSNTTLTAIAYLLDDLKTANIYSKFYALNLYAPDDLTAAITPIISTLGNNPWTNNNFVAGDITKYGLKGDGASKVLDTGVARDSVSHTNMALMVFTDTRAEEIPGTGSIDMGVRNSGAVTTAYQLNSAEWSTIGTLGGCYGDLPFDLGAGRTEANNIQTGYICVSRDGASSQKLFFANRWNTHSTVATNTGTPAEHVTNQPWAVHARRSGGVYDSYSPRRFKAAGIAQAFSEAESLALYNALVAYRERIEDGSQTNGEEWSSRVVKNGGAAPSAASVSAVDTLLNALDSGGILSKIDYIFGFCPDNLTAAITPIWRRWGLDPGINQNFILTDLSVNGLQGKTTAMLRSGIVSGRGMRSGQNTGWTFYAYSAPSGTSLQGVANGGDGYQFVWVAPNTLIWDTPYAGGVGRLTITNPATVTPGYFHAQRSAANAAEVFAANSVKAHASIGSSASSPGAITTAWTGLITAVARSDDGTSFWNGRVSFAAFGQALNVSESAIFYNAVQAFRTELGGGYV